MLRKLASNSFQIHQGVQNLDIDHPEVVDLVSPTTTSSSSSNRFDYEGEASEDTESLSFFPESSRSLSQKNSDESSRSSLEPITSSLDVTRLIKPGEYPGIQAYLSTSQEESTCAICQQSLLQKDRVFMSSPGCLHSNHHASCLLRWAKISNNCTCCKSRFNLAATVTFVNLIPGEPIQILIDKEWEIKDAVPDEFMDGNIAGLVPGTALALIELHAKCCVCGLEDEEDVEDEKEIEDPLILCDLACGGAIHLKCSKYPAVPMGHWFCPNCENTSQGRISDSVAEVVSQQQMKSPPRRRRRAAAQATAQTSASPISVASRSTTESPPTRSSRLASRLNGVTERGSQLAAGSSSSSSSSSWRISHLADLIASGVGGGRTRGDTVRLISSSSSASLKRAFSSSETTKHHESKSPTKKTKKKDQTVQVIVDEEEIIDCDDDTKDTDVQEISIKSSSLNPIRPTAQTLATSVLLSTSDRPSPSTKPVNFSKYFTQSKYFQPPSFSAVFQPGSMQTASKQPARPWEPKKNPFLSSHSSGSIALQQRPPVDSDSFAKVRRAITALRIVTDRVKSTSSSQVSASPPMTSKMTPKSTTSPMVTSSKQKAEPNGLMSRSTPTLDISNQLIGSSSSSISPSKESTPPLASSSAPLLVQISPGLSDSLLKAVLDLFSSLTEKKTTIHMSNAFLLHKYDLQLIDDRIYKDALIDILKLIEFPVKFLFQQRNSADHIDLGLKLLTLLNSLPFKTWDAYEMTIGIPSRPGVTQLCSTLSTITEKERQLEQTESSEIIDLASRFSKITLISSLLAVASAQLRSTDALVSWFSASDCKTDQNTQVKTMVILSQGICNRVPGDAAFPGYRVFCNTGETAGRVEYCRDITCTNCSVTRPFLSSGSCLPNDASSFGAASYNVRCPSPIAMKKTEAVAEAIAIPSNSFLVQWNAASTCASDNLQRTLVIGVQKLCQRVPANANGTGYKIECNSNGGGVISFCSAPDCSLCESRVPFLLGQCLQNDPKLFGSSSYSLSCPTGSGENGGGAGRQPILPPFIEIPFFPPTIDLPRVTVPTSLPSEGGKNGGIKIVILPTPVPVLRGPGAVLPKATVLPGALTPSNQQQPKASLLPGVTLPVAPVIQQPKASVLPGTASSIKPIVSSTNPWDTDYSAFPIIGARPMDFRATWFWEPGCTTSAGQYTGVVGTIGFCNAVPRSIDSGYYIKCLTDPITGTILPSGTFHVCQDYPKCNQCDSIIPFRDDQCLTQQSLQSARSQFGVASADFQCTKPLIPDAAPAPGRALLAWFEGADCNPSHRTLVDIRQDVCNRVPRGLDGGYRVTCSEDGSVGVYEVCDSTCTTCTVSTRFASDQCLANPKEFGSESVSIRCSKFSGNSTIGQGPKLGQSLPEQLPALNPSSPSPTPEASSGVGEVTLGLLSLLTAGAALIISL